MMRAIFTESLIHETLFNTVVYVRGVTGGGVVVVVVVVVVAGGGGRGRGRVPPPPPRLLTGKFLFTYRGKNRQGKNGKG